MNLNQIEALIEELVEEGFPCRLVVEYNPSASGIEPEEYYVARIQDMEDGRVILDPLGDRYLMAFGPTFGEALKKLESILALV